MFDEFGNWVDDPNANAGFDPGGSGLYTGNTANSNTGSGFDEFGNPIEGQTGAISTGSSTDLSGGLDTGNPSTGGFNLGSLGSILSGLFGGGGGGTTGTAASGLNLQKLLGALGGSALGIAGSKNVANKYDAMNNQYMGFSQP